MREVGRQGGRGAIACERGMEVTFLPQARTRKDLFFSSIIAFALVCFDVVHFCVSSRCVGLVCVALCLLLRPLFYSLLVLLFA